MLIHLWGYRKATASRGTINLIKIGTIKEDEVNHWGCIKWGIKGNKEKKLKIILYLI
jgi:hypothetical protein